MTVNLYRYFLNAMPIINNYSMTLHKTIVIVILLNYKGCNVALLNFVAVSYLTYGMDITGHRLYH